jgi:hypothetical protein
LREAADGDDAPGADTDIRVANPIRRGNRAPSDQEIEMLDHLWSPVKIETCFSPTP